MPSAAVTPFMFYLPVFRRPECRAPVSICRTNVKCQQGRTIYFILQNDSKNNLTDAAYLTPYLYSRLLYLPWTHLWLGLAARIGEASLESLFESLAKFVAAAGSTRANAGWSGLRWLRGHVVQEIG